MLVKSGTTIRNTQGVAAGASRRRMGGGVYGSTTTSKSALVATYAPPQRPQGGIYIVAMVVGAIGTLTVALAIVGIPLMIYGYRQMKRMPDRVQAWEEDLVRWSNLWVCKKCGNEWTPEEA